MKRPNAAPDAGPGKKSKQRPEPASAASDEQPKQKKKAHAPASPPSAAASASAKGADPSFWPYPTEYGDHFETSEQALQDLEPALYRLASHLGKAKKDLVVYDPFFCKGGVRELFKKIGVEKLVHEKRDFWADVDQGTVPDYDILVTNPPFSGDHKERIIKFCAESGKAWALLMPNYVANKSYWQEEVEPLSRAEKGTGPSTSAGSSSAAFYLVPDTKYEYFHPEGTGHSSSPFDSIWFCHLGKDSSRVLAWWEKMQKSKKPTGKAQVRVLRTVGELQEGKLVPSAKRLNPRQRKKLQQKAAADE